MALRLGSGVRSGDQTQHAVNGNDRRCTVADEGQGQTDNGHNTNAHAHIDHHLEDQRRSCTEADQTAGIVGCLNGHINAATNNSQLQQQNQQTAEETQLLTDGGEDVVRMLSEEVAALGTGTVEETLTRQTAAGKGQEVDLIVITFVDAQGVDGGVKKNQNSVSLVSAQELPQNGESNSDASNRQAKPNQADAAGKGHADENKHENQGNARISGKDHVQTDQNTQVEDHVGNGNGVLNSFLV